MVPSGYANKSVLARNDREQVGASLAAGQSLAAAAPAPELAPGNHVLADYTGRNSVLALSFSADGKLLASAGGNEFRAAGNAYWSVAFSPDGKTLASGSWDRIVRVWDATTGEARACIGAHEEEILGVAISADGRTLAAGSVDWTVRLWDTVTFESRTVLQGHRGGVRAVAFSPDDRTLVSAGIDVAPRLWQLPAGK